MLGIVIINGHINPYYWVDEFIPYYMEIMGVDRPDRTYVIFVISVYLDRLYRFYPSQEFEKCADNVFNQNANTLLHI